MHVPDAPPAKAADAAPSGDWKPEQPSAIEDYALLGDGMTAALVGRNGSIDWLCWPRFDSAACFAALLGDSGNGRWKIAPAAPATRITRAYRDASLVMETVFETEQGSIALIDFMVAGAANSSLVRIVEGRRGTVAVELEMLLRFDYGASVPWVTRLDGHHAVKAIVGPDMAVLRSDVELHGEEMKTVGTFDVGQGDKVCFTLVHGPSHLAEPPALDAEKALADTLAFWAEWTGRCTYKGRWKNEVLRSLVTLKALIYAPTGGMVAAPTTSLPEQLGGNRNWDYRFCWLRDATLTLLALMHAGYYEEAGEWGQWLHRSIAGSPGQIQIMYGLSGERRLAEWEVPWLSGYQGASPVRIGNGAATQLQIDVYGEVMDAAHHMREGGLNPPPDSWSLQRAVVEHLAEIWEQPDEGMWETRGGRRHFTLSKVMAWVALDRAIRDAERYDLPAPLDDWRALRDRIHETVCERGYDAAKNSFVQSFGSTELDASLLLIPLSGFLPPEDPRVVGTIAAIEHELMDGGFVLRYRTGPDADGLPEGEGAFLACSFWMVDNLHLQGRGKDAEAMFKRLLSLCNDVGLLAEEYDPRAQRQVGNFPQAFSHVALIASAMNLSGEEGPADSRIADAEPPTGD